MVSIARTLSRLMMETTLRATSEKLWSRPGQDFRWALQLRLEVLGEIALDGGAPGGGLQIAAGDDLAVLADGQAVGRVLEPAVERSQPLIARQHQKLDFRLPGRRLGIEPARAVLDGVAAVGGQGLADPQGNAGQGFRGEALDGIAVEAGNLGGLAGCHGAT
ncbi:hypothetical protein BRDID11002_32360 [Bradyrhizobium diazoefficiens]